jgi:transcriptional regulator with XRE-family HTH domain
MMKNLKICRNNKDVTQADVAKYLGVGEKTYQNYELGTREPSIEKLIALADYFDVSIDYLVGRKNN